MSTIDKVNKIDLQQAYILLREDKLIFSEKGSDKHYTMHMSPYFKVLDIHETTQLQNGEKQYRKIFSIPHEKIPLLIEEIGTPALAALQDALTHLDLDWMATNKIGVVVGFPVSKEESESVSVINGKKLSIDEQKILDNLWAPKYLDELCDLDNGSTFTLFKNPDSENPEKIGTGFVFVNQSGQKQLAWIQDEKLMDAIRSLEPMIIELAAKHGKLHEE